MRNDLKLGIVLGIVIVVVGIIFFVNRNDQPSLEEAPDVIPIPQTELPQLEKPEPTFEPQKEAATKPIATEPPPSSEGEVKPVDTGTETQETPSNAEPKSTESPPQEPQLKPEPAVPKPQYHTVVKGENLYSISEQYYGHGRFWKVISDANRNIITDAEKLQVGWKLRIPSPEEVVNKN